MFSESHTVAEGTTLRASNPSFEFGNFRTHISLQFGDPDGVHFVNAGTIETFETYGRSGQLTGLSTINYLPTLPASFHNTASGVFRVESTAPGAPSGGFQDTTYGIYSNTYSVPVRNDGLFEVSDLWGLAIGICSAS